MTLPDIRTCLHKVHGYELYKDESSRPYVIRHFTVRTKESNGVTITRRETERLELDGIFPSNVTGQEARKELLAAWDLWEIWNEDNRSAT